MNGLVYSNLNIKPFIKTPKTFILDNIGEKEMNDMINSKFFNKNHFGLQV